MKKGRIMLNGVYLEKHEMSTVIFLAEAGYDIELIKPSNIQNRKSPDFRMMKMNWEMKSPIGKSKSTIEHAFNNAVKQSENIIFDLRRINIPENKAITILTKLMVVSKCARKLGIITKSKKILWFPFDK